MQVLQAQKQREKGLQKDEARGGLRVIGRCKMGKVVTVSNPLTWIRWIKAVNIISGSSSVRTG